MFQKLSYFNLVFSLIYVLIYLKDGTLNSTLGILAFIVFSWLGLRSYQLDNYKWNLWQYLAGLWSLYYAGFLIYGSVNILISSFEYDFVSNDTILFLTLTFVLTIAVVLHFVIYFRKNLTENSRDKNVQ
ncbi:hypothetical protein [Pedobacter boryungensis]|uniref:Uncharacterized protein n=1 Tax=Pedobacter boryungensis TaxID=869962 RepID=A0ABX2DC75_9SPHI|nr:hypothetical protein [Pedobacter boryungensis]NQX31681.1 hypothetical protein [Pedobacter boryungensis]